MVPAALLNGTVVAHHGDTLAGALHLLSGPGRPIWVGLAVAGIFKPP